jgi:hypothetical protein
VDVDRKRPGSSARRVAAALAFSVLWGWLMVVAAPTPPASAGGSGGQPCPCPRGYTGTCHWPGGGTTVCHGGGEDPPPTDPDPTTPSPTGPPDDDPEPTWCPPRQWITLGGYDSVPAHIRPTSWDDAPPDAIFQYDRCTCPNSISYCPGGTTRWIMPNDPLPLPDPEEVADGVWADVQSTLEQPALDTDPPLLADMDPQDIPPECNRNADVCANVNLATFVAVTNWQGEIREEACDPTDTICVAITATPSLTWNPGEELGDGRRSRTIPCEDGGTEALPESQGGTAEEQAERRGACAHIYRHRTTVDGRPSTWDGVVTVTWEATWETISGPVTDSGDFPDISESTDLTVSVPEISTAVYDDFRRGSES